MSDFVKNVVWKGQLGGAERTVTLRPMTYLEALDVSDAEVKLSARAQKLTGKELAKATTRAMLVAQHSVAASLVPGAVQSIEPPVLDQIGNILDPAEVMGAAYFGKAIQEITAEWVTEASPADPKSPGESSVANSQAPRSSTSTPVTEVAA